MVDLQGMDPLTYQIGVLMIHLWMLSLLPILCLIAGIGGYASANPVVNVVVHQVHAAMFI